MTLCDISTDPSINLALPSEEAYSSLYMALFELTLIVWCTYQYFSLQNEKVLTHNTYFDILSGLKISYFKKNKFKNVEEQVYAYCSLPKDRIQYVFKHWFPHCLKSATF